MISTLLFLLSGFNEVQSKQLLLLKQRSRLDNLFSYEIKECIKSATLLPSGVWSVPASIPQDGRKQFDYSSLTSVRAVINDIAFATTPQSLVDIVRGLNIEQPLLWTIEYECLAPLEHASTVKQGNISEDEIAINEDSAEAVQSNENLLKYSSAAADRKSFSSKTLFCAISQCIKGAPALDTRDAAIFYFILETASGFHFGSAAESLSPLGIKRYSASTTLPPYISTSVSPSVTVNDPNSDRTSLKISSNPASSVLSIKEFWAGRPFIFSAALNIEIAESVMNILKERLKERSQLQKVNEEKEKEKENNKNNNYTTDNVIENDKGEELKRKNEYENEHERMDEIENAMNEEVFTVLDPCCGSGTTLFVGRRLGFRAIGSDVNTAFISGTAANLLYAGYPLVRTPDRATLIRSTDSDKNDSSGRDVFSSKDVVTEIKTKIETERETDIISASVSVSVIESSIDKNNVITDDTNLQYDTMEVETNGKGPLLQLFIKDASYPSSPWVPYHGAIEEKENMSAESTITLKTETERELDREVEEVEVQGEGEVEVEVEVVRTATVTVTVTTEGSTAIRSEPFRSQSIISDSPSVIQTTGRTKRYLQEKKLGRVSPQFSPNDPQGPWGTVDCVFCNFPWGENIFEYYNETENILKILGKKLKNGCECAFITKKMIGKDVLEDSGFVLRDVIPIGDDGVLGNGIGKGRGKGRGRGIDKDKSEVRDKTYLKKSKESDIGYGNDNKVNTGDCFITFAIVAPTK